MTTSSAELEPTPQSPTRPARQVSFGLLAGLLGAFVGGAVTILLAQNILSKEALTFSTTGLIGFLFGVALAAASTVLSIAAILLGKASEHAMIDRSDVSIGLQNQVFAKTTEALSRIESSTGVTEKRIEDIISGRAGELSRVIAERISSEGGKSPSPAALEREIRESLLSQLSPGVGLQTAARLASRQQSEEEANKAYRKFQNDLLIGIANSGAVKSEKIGDGSWKGLGNDLFDGVFLRGDQRVAVSTFTTHAPLANTHVDAFNRFLLSAARELDTGNYGSVIIAFDGALNPEGPYRTTYKEVASLLKPEVVSKILLVDGPDSSALQAVVDHVTKLPGSQGALKLASQ